MSWILMSAKDIEWYHNLGHLQENFYNLIRVFVFCSIYSSKHVNWNCQGRIDVIELTVEQMHQDQIQPDPSTCSHVFSAYTDNGFHNTAMEALQVLSMRMISEQDDILQKNRLEYENLIFEESSEAESRIIEVFKDSAHLAVALLYLRWCATLQFPISWSPNQSPWAKRLSSDYASRRCD